MEALQECTKPLSIEPQEGVHAYAATRVRRAPAPERRRMADFEAGRFCAKRALEQATGRADHEIPVGADRAPLWPTGWVGSLTHTDRFVAAVVAPSTLVRSIGIDSEEWMSQRVSDEIRHIVFRSGEWQRAFEAGTAAGWTAPEMTTLAFSAKESLYKCLAPLVKRFFDFQEAELVAFDSVAGALTLELKVDLTTEFRSGMRFEVRFEAQEERVHTSVSLAHSPIRH